MTEDTGGHTSFTLTFQSFDLNWATLAVIKKDSHAIRSISFHPSGDFIVAGTDHEAPRTFDVKSGTIYTPPNATDWHRGAINCARYSSNGSQFATCSDDGSVKIFDVVSGRCISTIDNAHKSSPVWSCKFTRNNKYVLTTGGDSTVKLWDTGSGRAVRSYDGASFVVSFSRTRKIEVKR